MKNILQNNLKILLNPPNISLDYNGLSTKLKKKTIPLVCITIVHTAFEETLG